MLQNYKLVEIEDIQEIDYNGTVYDLEIGGESGDHSYNIDGIIVHNSVCTTRRMTGIGYPQLSAIIEASDAAHGLGGLICGDGGCTVPGDLAKGFGAGADFIMLGGMLAGHRECNGEVTGMIKKLRQDVELVAEERDTYAVLPELGKFLYIDNTPGHGKMSGVGGYPRERTLPDNFYEMIPTENSKMKFYGMSSKEAMDKHAGGVAEYRASEGKSVEIPYRGPVENTIREILGGLRSSCTYVGARKLKELSKRTTFIRVSQQINEVFGRAS
jgi:GMP reductase